MERKYFKALNFDLDTHQLQEHYPGANYRQAYDDLRRFFKKHRFLHRQGIVVQLSRHKFNLFIMNRYM